MELSGFRLEKEEIARQIHYAVREIYPERQFDADLIYEMLVEEKAVTQTIVFLAERFAEVNGLDKIEFSVSLYCELDVEFEKNLHDKFLFTMKREEGNIVFQTTDK